MWVTDVIINSDIEKMESALLQNPSARINHIASMVYILCNKMHMEQNKSVAGAST